MTARPPAPPPHADDAFDGKPEHAWRALTLVIDWNKHAETKAGLVLAASGVTGGVLFNLVKNKPDPGVILGSFAVVCATAILLAGISAAMCFLPQLTVPERPRRPARRTEPGPEADPSPLFFHDIATKHPRRPHTYYDDLHRLTSSPETLVREIAEQVWANSQVTDHKYTWATRAVICLLIAVLGLGLVALYVGVRSVLT